jgi:formylglycine-generating enzyme required for sulfatase activity/dienelactone hydrolase
VKPSNILVDRPDSAPQGNGAQRGVGRYVLVDFGLVRDEEAGTLTRSGEMVGTLGYMSPEQVSRRPVDRRTDVYSLGATLYEILTLRAPCGGDGKSEHLVQAAILFKEPVPPRKLQPRLSRDLETVVLKAIEKDPDRRYASAGGFAADLRRCLRGEPIEAKPPSTWTRISRRALRNKLRVGLAASVLIAASAIGVLAWSFGDGRAERVARETLLPQIERLVEKEDFLAAHDLARQAEGTIPGDPLLGKLWARLSWSYTITTDPPGANVSYKRYEVLDGEWIHLGKSPLENVRFPRGVYRWRVELGGFETRECGQGRGAESERRLHFDLQRSEGHPPGMVWIGPGELPAYWIDKFEVTNAEFQEFVDRGGYQDRQHWQFPFIQDGRTLAFEDAMAQLRDTTGLPGPSTWEKGRYPQGRENYPVAGLSWFEAAAFARFKGKSLPTTRHWYEAACPFEASLIVRFSNFDGKESAPVGSHQGIGITGVYDMAGNVKEWCYNATDDAGSRRYLLGGAWGEPTYLFTDQNAQSPWDRSLQNGFRCVWHPRGEETIPESTLPPFARLFRRDYRKEKPVSDEEVEFFKRELYSYDRTDLEAKVESVDDTAESWRREKISFVPAYGGERMLAYLFLPKGFQPPYQTVILWPGSNVRVNRPLEGLEAALFTEYLIQSGRALLLPIYEGTYERFIETTSLPGPVAGRDRCIRRTQDLRRSIDYLETRDDIQKDKLAYYGLSWGAGIAPIPLVIEPRVRVAVLVVGGFFDGEPHPAADPFNFAPRVRVPVLMVNGEHDMNFPVEASQKPMFDLLGTPPEHKKHVLYPGGHGLNGLFGREIRAEVLGWLDRYLGPVSR